VKHCFEICRHVKRMKAGQAIEFLNEVLRIDSDRADVRRKAAAVPFRLGQWQQEKEAIRSVDGRTPQRAASAQADTQSRHLRAIIKLIESAMENARHQYEDMDPEEMEITHCAAHRGQIKRGWTPRARGRASPKNHYRVNLELFLEDFSGAEDELEDDF
jgi:large subunit ribosomal protein L22